MTIIASKCYSPILLSFSARTTASSSILNRRHTTATTLLPVTKTCVLNRVKTSIAQIKLLNSQLDNIEAQMAGIMKFHDSVIMTIPGIDYINDRMTLGEIDDIHHFPSPTELPAFADLTWCFLFTSLSMPYNI